jgi:hypothetical protein
MSILSQIIVIYEFTSLIIFRIMFRTYATILTKLMVAVIDLLVNIDIWYYHFYPRSQFTAEIHIIIGLAILKLGSIDVTATFLTRSLFMQPSKMHL